MEPVHVVVALISAFLHAAWNAAVKAQPAPGEVMTAQMILAAAIGVPALLWTGLPAIHVWPWILGASGLGTIAVLLLLKAYETGAFAVVYPAWRAMIVLISVPAATLLVGERLGLGAAAGVILIGAALLLLALAARPGAQAGTAGFAALGWTTLSALFGAACLLCDAVGVRTAGSPWAYGICTSLLNAAAMSWRQRAGGTPAALVLRHAWIAGPAAVASMISYLAILWVYAHAPIAPSAALRDTSAVFAILIAVFVLRERLNRLQTIAVACAALAVPLLRLG
jgi:drug/metabolite transporter (DMT)-like permease